MQPSTDVASNPTLTLEGAEHNQQSKNCGDQCPCSEGHRETAQHRQSGDCRETPGSKSESLRGDAAVCVQTG